MAKPKKKQKINEIWGLILLGATIFLFLSLISYNPNDISYYRYPPNNPCRNIMGPAGAWLSFVLYFIFGLSSYLIVFTGLIWGICNLGKKPFDKRPDIFIFAWCLAIISTSGLLALLGHKITHLPLLTTWQLPGLGGIMGTIVTAHFLVKYFGSSGTFIIMGAVAAIATLYITDIRLRTTLNWSGGISQKIISGLCHFIGFNLKKLISLPIKSFQKRRLLIKQRQITSPSLVVNKPEIKKLAAKTAPIANPPEEKNKVSKITTTLSRPFTKPAVSPVPANQLAPGEYKLPTLDLLDPSPPGKDNISDTDLTKNARLLESTLKEFGININVTSIQRGPVVTLYEISLAPGTKVGKITALADDIALAMRVGSVRIIAPIPGKAAVGIEVPNIKPKFVYLRDVLSVPEFVNSDVKIPLALGMDVSGTPLISDLSAMPHLLIAGTTGSGKTVCLNALILSMLYKLTPDELKFLMVDPKLVELAPYKNIPHLLIPLIHEPKKASFALSWVVREMERRYELFANVGVRNIEGYNTRPGRENCKKISELEDKLTELDYQNTPPATLPYIVIIIDELADLMMVAQTDIETAIGRLAQLSRAVGIHIVLATQRPSVDVLTGVIKANFSTRISFQVASKVDARTVLDTSGADKLLGKGDMLFMPPGSSKLIRAQCTLVRDAEIKRVVNFISSQKKPQFATSETGDQVFHNLQKVHQENAEKDPLYEQAVDVVLTTQQPSVSVLQRKLRIGYNRAARIIDMMEAQGIISPLDDGKREIILDRNEIKL